ncbi:MAG: competence/damage-inducible protein A [Candidatus Omnitrophica bacterium]|nr:competence/damage-inducible protein A [Candidatus Omnitrophota bacterium]
MPGMEAEILSIGSELTSGQTVNTNAAYLARRLREAGFDCPRQAVVADERTLIVQSVREALRRSRLLLITGGLGPTFDDLTMAAIAQATGRRLVLVPAVARRIRAFCRRHQRSLTTPALRQAYLPQGAAALPNPIGSAPGVWLALGGTILVALPGVPQEMRAITEASVLPRLRRRTRRAPIRSRTLRTVGVVELEIQRLLKTVPVPAGMALGLYPNLRAVDVCLTMRGSSSQASRRALRAVERAIRARLGAAVYGLDEQTLESVVGGALVARHKTLAVAESCTGGLVSDRLTNVPGSSRYLLAALVAYHNRAKQEWLGVPGGLLLRDGAVSAPVARAMAQGIRRCAGADVGLAITGIAGPGGGTPAKPVGLVYLAVADARGSAVERFRFQGERAAIKGQAVQMALNLLRKRLLRRR